MFNPINAALCSTIWLAAISSLAAEQFLYFNSASGDIYRSLPNGSSVSVLRSNAGTSVHNLFLTHEHIYYSDRFGNTLNRMDLDGGNHTVLADASDGVSSPRGLTLSHQGSGLFFGSRVGFNNGKIEHLDFTTGAITEFVPNVTVPGGLEMKNGTLFWIDTRTDTIWMRSTFGPPAVLVTIPAASLSLSDLVITRNDGGFITLYATSSTEIYRVTKLPLATNPGVTVIHSDASASFAGIDADDTHLYFADRASDRVLRYELGVGPATVVQTAATSPGLDTPAGIAITQIPGVSINDVTASEANGSALFTVSLTLPPPCDVFMKVETANESATFPFDYLGPPNLLTIPAGATSGTIVVPIVNDGALEPEETFIVNLGKLNFGKFTDASGRATIITRSTIENTKKRTWGQNIGWTLWSPATGPQDFGTSVVSNYLVGKIWNQNVGWINLGNGSPADGVRYSNATPTDFGVNLLPGGILEGRAWGQNIGWVSFEQVRGKPKIDYVTGQFSGYAWSQNCGWLNLGSNTSHYAQTALIEIVDSDNDMIDDNWEFAQGASNLSELSKTGDADGDGTSDLDEFNADSDPFDGGDYLELIALSTFPELEKENVELIWTSSASRLYDVFASDDLLDWGSPAASNVRGLGPTTDLLLSEPLPLPVREFWKVDSKRPLTP